jgi:ADP-heptose:LPS heptosyltransferase
MKVLVVSKNLIGDALYTSCAMNAYLLAHPGTEFTVLTLQDHVTPVYSQFGFPVEVLIDGTEEAHQLCEGVPWDAVFDLGAGDAGKLADQVLREEKKYLHIAQCYGRKMGVEVTDLRPTYRPSGYLNADDAAHTKDVIFISPFSMSCTSRDKNRPGMPPNKMLPWSTWTLILRQLRTFSLPIRCLGAKDDRVPALSLSEEEYFTGVPLNCVAQALQQCKMLITVDNGMGHIANTLLRPTVVFYPSVLPVSFMGALYNPRCVIIHTDPANTPPLNLYLTAKEGIEQCIHRDNNLKGATL